MSKLNSKEKKQKKQLVNELKKSPTLAYLASELDKINDMVVKILLKDFSTLRKRMILMSMIDAYNIIADRWCSNYKNYIANFPFPYETKSIKSAPAFSMVDRIDSAISPAFSISGAANLVIRYIAILFPFTFLY